MFGHIRWSFRKCLPQVQAGSVRYILMKKVLLAGIAALLLSGAVSRADKLPKQMLGDWCEAESGQFFERGTCERKFKLKGNGYEGYADTEGYGCDFKSIRQLTGSSWFVRSECGGEAGLVPGDHVIAIEGKTLKIINVTVSVCLAVIDPPAEVTKDPECKADSWLVLREAPDTKSKAVVKLGNKEKLEADEIRDDWTHVSNVIRLSEADASPNQKPVQGWVRSKYLVERQCYDDPANEPLPPPDEPPPAKYDRPFNGVMRVDHDVAACIKMRSLVPGEIRLGCTDRRKTADAEVLCVVHMLPDKELKRYGFSPERLLRHNIGHCNGWPDDHSVPSSETPLPRDTDTHIDPPAKYVRHFDGEIVIFRDMSICDDSLGPKSELLGCSGVNDLPASKMEGLGERDHSQRPDEIVHYCIIAIQPDDVLKARGYTALEVTRHEVAHCNGWPNDHPREEIEKR
jgi:hypothetical protein